MLVVLVLACFAAALLAPWLHRVLAFRAAWLLAVVPAAVAIWLARQIPAVVAGSAPSVSIPWLDAVGVALAFRLDGLALLFGLLITVIGAFVGLYSGAYLKGHVHLGRFLLYLYLFMGAMLGVVLADDLISLFVFWELTSISSFFLIGFNTEDPESRRSALMALLVTGGGGLALLAGLVLLGIATGETTLSGVNAAGSLAGEALYLPVLLLVLLGAFTKSAQFPFHFWLPGAMVAPTPVSAYLHSATMVKAGVYLMARLYPALSGTAWWTGLLVAFGLATFIVGAVVALRQTDLKRILAYTTLSMLGLLTFLLGLGTTHAVEAAMAFLLAHALYKGALFLVAGVVDHGTGTRDIRRLGGLRKAMPWTAAAAAVTAASFAGVPLLFGFVAKEAALSAVLEMAGGTLLALIVAVTLLAGLLAAYLAGILPFWGRAGDTPRTPHEGGPALLAGPVTLAALTLFFGIRPAWPDQALVSPASSAVLGQTVHAHLVLWHGINTPLLLSAGVLLAGIAILAARLPIKVPLDRATGFLDRWRPERIYEHGLALTLAGARRNARFWQNGHLRHYLAILIGTTGLLTLGTLLLRGGLPQAADVAWGLRFHEAVLAGVLITAAFAVTRVRSRIAAVAVLGVVGYAIALFFVIFSAPDLAMTQFLFETLTVLIFALVLWGMPLFKARSTRGARVRDAVLCGGVGVAVALLVLAASAVRLHEPVSRFYGAQSYVAAHGRNVVNVILVDFRGLDTLGEITVLAVAALGVIALLRLRLRGGETR